MEWSGWVGCFSAIELLKLTLKIAVSNASRQIPQESEEAELLGALTALNYSLIFFGKRAATERR